MLLINTYLLAPCSFYPEIQIQYPVSTEALEGHFSYYLWLICYKLLLTRFYLFFTTYLLLLFSYLLTPCLLYPGILIRKF